MKYFYVDDYKYPSKFGEMDLKQFKRTGIDCHLATSGDLDRDNIDVVFEGGRAIVLELNCIEELDKVQEASNIYLWIDPKHRTIVGTPYYPD